MIALYLEELQKQSNSTLIRSTTQESSGQYIAFYDILFESIDCQQ